MFYLKYIFIVLVCLPIHLSAQEQTIQADTLFNQIDGNGLKQGFWKKHFENGHVKYTGQFKDDKPFGTFLRYYESKTLQSMMEYRNQEDISFTKFYYENGELAAEGLYIGTKKDSIWNYYSYYGGHLSFRESYQEGSKSGVSYKYFEDGKTSEELGWANDKKHGVWRIWYPNGTLHMSTSYNHGNLEGPFESYMPDGKREISGHYKNNLRDGIWSFYDLVTKTEKKISYNNGIAENQGEINEAFEETMKMYEQNKGKFKDPNLNDIMKKNDS